MTDAYMPPAKTVEWSTPEWIFGPLHDEFDFTIDAAATADNAKLNEYWTRAIDGLKQPWHGHTVWVNPPWPAEDLRAWTQRAWIEAKLRGVTTVMLVPVKSDQDWWHLYALGFAEIRFILGRVTFGGAKSTYPGPAAVLVFGPDIKPCVKTLAKPPK